ncbi:MAG: 30S ribosomal protein S24e [Candidatus Diapherotrites archaeon]|nr:30S ribosomal protein S24e [Candidatus Diapherotrites archaeon]
MKVEIAGKRDNKSLQRAEVRFNVKDAAVTPNRKELRAKLAALQNSKEELVIVDSIMHNFGLREASGEAKIYKDEKALKAAERPFMIGRNIGQKKKPGEKKAKKAAAAKKEEAAPAKKDEKPAKEEKAAPKQEEAPAPKKGEKPAQA